MICFSNTLAEKRDFILDYLDVLGQKYYKKRGYINEGYFGILKNARKFQTLERQGIKNTQKELTIKSNRTQYPKNTRKSKYNININ